MSGTLPNTSFTAINLLSIQKTLFSETDSGKSFRRQVQGQRFSFTVSYPPMKRADFAPIMAFIMKQRSRQEDFTTLKASLNALIAEKGAELTSNGVKIGVSVKEEVKLFSLGYSKKLKQDDLEYNVGFSFKTDLDVNNIVNLKSEVKKWLSEKVNVFALYKHEYYNEKEDFQFKVGLGVKL